MVSFVPSISLVASYVMSSMVKYSSKYVLFHCADHKEVYSGYDWLSDQRPKQVKVDAKQPITLYRLQFSSWANCCSAKFICVVAE
jgi:hypothetical protein